MRIKIKISLLFNMEQEELKDNIEVGPIQICSKKKAKEQLNYRSTD